MKLYDTGLVMRYHTHIQLNRFNQTNAQHQWGCAALIEAWHPDPSLNLFRAAVFHDSGELDAGDLAYHFKRDNPELASAHRDVEEQALWQLVKPFNLTDVEKQWLKLVDRVECFLHVNHYMPELLRKPDWQKAIQECHNLAAGIGVEREYVEMLKGFEIYEEGDI